MSACTLESFFRATWGEWKSSGIADTTSDDLLDFFRQRDKATGAPGQIVISRIVHEGTMVTIHRSSLISKAPAERNEILFATEQEAEDFALVAFDLARHLALFQGESVNE